MKRGPGMAPMRSRAPLLMPRLSPILRDNLILGCILGFLLVASWGVVR